MKSWSRYNTLFRSDKFGRFLYNALSGVMLELDEHHYKLAQSLHDGESISPSGNDEEYFELLEGKKILSTREDELQQLMKLHYRRNVACFSTTYFGLTICPTLACNFTCPYCFEKSQDDSTIMSTKTINALLAFIKKHQDAKHLSVCWYGGEPTLGFDVIKTLTKRFIELYPDYDNSGLVTNAYLLDHEKIDQLDELKIKSVQITLDGTEQTHNRRRMLKNGEPTYTQILRNIDLLMDSAWKGNCAIRVNVDRTNQHEYTALHTELQERYKGKQLTVYPGHVNTFHNYMYEQKRCLSNSEWVEFIIGGYKKEGTVLLDGFYPRSGTQNTCVATSYYGYVIGPKGELYKCWEDVGIERMAIGSLHDKNQVVNQELVARYSISTDPFKDRECIECTVFPICGGGCVRKRLLSQQFGEIGIEYCSLFKESLQSYLEAYLDALHTKEICAAVLGISTSPSKAKGYSIVHPDITQEEDVKNPLKLEFISNMPFI
jgi:uncharacterized protein